MNTATRRKEAAYWEQAEWEAVACRLCPHFCMIAPSRAGVCGVRTNRDGVLYTENYGRVTAAETVSSHMLPLYHYRPADRWLLIGTKGCTMRCPFCYSYQYSQKGSVPSQALSPLEVVERAAAEGVCGIGFGVNEPAVSHEFIVDVFAEAHRSGLRTFLATSGMWSEEAFQEALSLTDALTIGLKGFDSDSLRAQCGGIQEAILRNLEVAVASDTHVEVSYLVGNADRSGSEEARDFRDWLVARAIDIPLILIPLRQASGWEGSTPEPRVSAEIHRIFADRLSYVYLHDSTSGLMDTHCPQCASVLVRRTLAETRLSPELETTCPNCCSRLPISF